MQDYIEELRSRKAEGRYPLDAYEEGELAKADALIVKRKTFKAGDRVYLPELGDRPGKNTTLILIFRDRRTGIDMALLNSGPGFNSSYPLEYVEPEPPYQPVNDGVLLVIFILVPVLLICGFLYHSM